MGEVWSSVKKYVRVGFNRFLNGDEKSIERNRIQKHVGKLEAISRKLDALKRREPYCKNNEIRTIINNHIKEIRILIQSTQLQEASIKEKPEEMACLIDLRKSLDTSVRHGLEALERVEKREFNMLQNEEYECE